MNPKIQCEECSQDFIPSRKTQKICPIEHERVCVICGALFAVQRNKLSKNPKVCGPSCGAAFSHLPKDSERRVIDNKVKIDGNGERTFLNISKPNEKKCPVCSKIFLAKKSKQLTCSRACGDEVAKLSRKKTIKEKYGVSNPMQKEEFKNKQKSKILDKYGVENPSQAPEIQEKIKKTNLRKYGKESFLATNESRESLKEANLKNLGVEYPLQSKDIQEKIKKTVMDKYGVPHISLSEDVRNRAKKSLIKKYGEDNPFKSEAIRKKIKETNLLKYGYEYASSNPDVIKKKKETTKKLYGYSSVFEDPARRKLYSETMKKKYGYETPSWRNMKNIDDWKDFDNWLLSQKNELTIEEIRNYFNVSSWTLYMKLNKKGNEHLKSKVKYVSSSKEELFKKFLKDNHKNIEVKVNDRKVIAPKELDFYFPGHSLAVEISPTSTHNSLFGIYSEEGKPKGYHLEKFLECEKNGIELITIFDWMPWDKTLEMISHKLSATTKRIGANKTEAFTVKRDSSSKSKVLKDFIDSNHVLGFINTRKTEYFSYLEDKKTKELLAVAAWGSMTGKRNKPGVIELKRMVFKGGYSIPGGASKLLKSFERNFEELSGEKLLEIITFSDCDLGTGSIYSKIGFENTDKPKPGRNFVSLDYEQPSRPGTSWRIKESSLVWQGADRLLASIPEYRPIGLECQHESKDGSKLHVSNDCLPSNVDIARLYGFIDVYDCGYKTWKKTYSL